MPDPCTPTERAVLLGWLFAHGKRMTAVEVAALLGVKGRRARALLCEASRVIPIYKDDGTWGVCVQNGTGRAVVNATIEGEDGGV